MPASNIAPNKGTKVLLNGEQVTVRFTMYSIRWLAERYGTALKAFEIFQQFLQDDGANSTVARLDALRDIVYAALINDNQELTLDDVSKNYDLADIERASYEIITEFIQAMTVQPVKTGKKKVLKALKLKTGHGNIFTRWHEAVLAKRKKISGS